MTDPRYRTLADLLVGYSTQVKKGEKVLLDMMDVPDAFTVALARSVRDAGAIPLIETRHTRVTRELLCGMTEEQATLMRDIEMARMKKVQSYIVIRGAANTSENSDVPGDSMSLYSKVMRPVLNYRVNKTRWCVLRWPTPSMAQAANIPRVSILNPMKSLEEMEIKDVKGVILRNQSSEQAVREVMERLAQ